MKTTKLMRGGCAAVVVALTMLSAAECFAGADQTPTAVASYGGNEIRLYSEPLAYEVVKDGVTVVPKTQIGISADGAVAEVGAPKVTKERKGGRVRTDVYKKASVDLACEEAKADFGGFAVRLVARRDAVAWRFELPTGGIVRDETADLTVPDEADCWFYRTPKADLGCEESPPENARGASLPNDVKKAYYMPFVYKVADKVVAVSEANVRGYPVWNFGAVQKTPVGAKLTHLFARYPKTTRHSDSKTKRRTAKGLGKWILVDETEDFIANVPSDANLPWRVFMLADSFSKLCECDAVYALSDAPAEGSDFSWVKPGKVAWEWWCSWEGLGDKGRTTALYRRFIDFAAKHGAEYVLVDEGWSQNLDIWRAEPNVDIPEIIAYGKERGIGVILWMAWAQVYGDEERVASHFSKLGVKGLKVDFMDRADADVASFLERLSAACAKYRLVLDYHGAYHPHGLQREFPNILNYEGIHAMEWMKWAPNDKDMSANDVGAFFMRLSTGPMDYTPGAMDNYPIGAYTGTWRNPGSVGTRSHQIALMSLTEAPLQMYCDSPAKYERNKECLSYMEKIPTVWADTVGLGGTPGTFAAVARKAKDGSWWASAISNRDARDFAVDTSFLGEGEWSVEMFRDAEQCGRIPSAYVHEKIPVKAGDKIPVRMASGGGFSMHFTKGAAKSAKGGACVKDLAGTWRVSGKDLSGEVHLPGTLADAKLGRHMTAADWEKDTERASKGALTREYQYLGTAVYEREFELSEEEARYPLELVLERVMGYSEVAIDGKTIGSCDSLATAHVYPIPKELTSAGRHTIRLTLDNSNRYAFSCWAHSYGPVMQSVWHGVVGELALRLQNPLRQSRVFASYPANGVLKVEVPETYKPKDGEIRISKFADGPAEESSLDVLSENPSSRRKGFKVLELSLRSLGGVPKPWSDVSPNLYVLELRDEAAEFAHQIRFGFRSVSAHNHALWINGDKWFMRGNLDCCHFPLTGAPAMTKEWWRETFRRLRDEDGINTIRFHSWTPPKAAFDVADEMGMMLAVEAGIWQANWMKCLLPGNGEKMDAFIQRELRAILEAHANSPSFISLAVGNELNGNYVEMGKWMDACKAFDKGRLYFVAANGGTSDADDFLVTARDRGVGRIRMHLEPGTDWDYEQKYSKAALTLVPHEIGQWPVYVDWDQELPRYTGVMRPYNLEHYHDVAKRAGTMRFWPLFCKTSARLNRLMYKDEVESFMRTPSCAGFQLLSVQDFTGQFEAMVGWRDSFYELKPGARDLPPFKDISNTLPHLARFEKYTWSVGETFKAKLQVRNLTGKTLPAGTEFDYFCAGRRGKMRLASALRAGELCTVGEVSLPLAAEMAGKKHLLRFGSNFWPFWVFDAPQPGPAAGYGVLETASLDEAVSALARGEKVLYTGKSGSCDKSWFKPVYWSSVHFPSRKAELSSLGYIVRDGHPALRGFPTEDWSDWQWYRLVEGGIKHGLSAFPKTLDPIVMPVGDLHYSTFMGTLFELKVGEGRIMVCGLNLSDMKHPEVRAMKASILSYMQSKDFNPATSFGVEDFKDAFSTAIPKERRRPPEFAGAPVYIAAAVFLDKERRTVPWKSSRDLVEMKEGGYSISGRGIWGTWMDATGSFWHGQGLTITLTGVSPVNGTLHVRFRDPNKVNRTGRGTCEGRAFDIPKHQDNKDGIWWAKLPIVREDALDGKIELTCEALSGPNLMIDRIVLTEGK